MNLRRFHREVGGRLSHLLGTPFWAPQEEGCREAGCPLCIPMVACVPMEGSVSGSFRGNSTLGTANGALTPWPVPPLFMCLSAHPHLFGHTSWEGTHLHLVASGPQRVHVELNHPAWTEPDFPGEAAPCFGPTSDQPCQGHRHISVQNRPLQLKQHRQAIVHSNCQEFFLLDHKSDENLPNLTSADG